jgi:hypothetical protein
MQINSDPIALIGGVVVSLMFIWIGYRTMTRPEQVWGDEATGKRGWPVIGFISIAVGIYVLVLIAYGVTGLFPGYARPMQP